MSTAGGPRLEGIGRSGDSDIVMCMDAHDAGSYPGEPTTNLIPYYDSRNPALVASKFAKEALWTSAVDSTDVIAPDGSSTTTKAVTGTSGNSYFYSYIDNNMGVTMASSTTYTISVWAKTTSTASTAVSLAFQDRGNGNYNTSVKTITTEWQRFSLTITTGSGATSYTLIGWVSPTNSRTFYFWGWQVEQKAYATPYVVSQLLDPSAQGPSARPASINLMIHGDVGPDTVAGSNNPNVLSEAISKFETAVGWTVGQDWSINSGTEVAEITSWTQASFLQRAASPAEVIEGGRYVIKGDVTTSNAGTLYARVGNSSYAVLPTGTGSTVEVVCGNTATETVLFYSGGWEGTIDNVSVAPLAVMKDSSPSKHAITTVNDTTHSAVQSKFNGGSIYFDGASDYLSLADSNEWDFGQGDFTVDFWLGHPTDTGVWCELFSQGWTSGSDSWMIGIDWGSSNKLQFLYTTDGSTDVATGYTTSTISTSAWTHIAVVRSSFSGQGSGFTSAIKVYVNGTQEVSYTSGADTIYNSTKPLLIGQRETSVGSHNYKGYMDEVRITKGTALWRGTFTPPTRRNLSAPVVDRSGNHNGANLINGTDTDTSTYRVGEVIRPIESAVWDFDATDEFLTTPFGSGRNVYTNPVSVCAWVKADSTTAARMWLDVGSNGTNQRFYCALITASNPSIFGTQGNAWAYSANADTSKWYHQALVMDNGTARAYYDGIAAGTRAFTSYTLPSYVRIGGRSGYEWDGKIAAVQIYDTILTPQQVKENFNSQRSRFGV